MFVEFKCEDCRFRFSVGSYAGGLGRVVLGVCVNCGLHVQGPSDFPLEAAQVEEAINNGVFEGHPNLKRQLENRIMNHNKGLPARLHYLTPTDFLSDKLTNAHFETPMEDWAEVNPTKDCPICGTTESLAYSLGDVGGKCPACGSENLKMEEWNS